MADKMGAAFDKVYKAVDTAFGKMQTATGQSLDADLEQYTKLQKPDFQVLMDNFGIDAVTDYIKNMESRRKEAG